MDPRIRWGVAVLAAALVFIRVFVPNFLSATAFDVPFIEGGVSWWAVVFWPLVTLAAWLITPGFVSLVGAAGKRWFIPAIVFIALIAGALFLWDTFWNSAICRLFGDDCIRSRLAQSAVRAMFGGP